MNIPQLGQAIYDRWQSMKRKLPMIVFAAFACYGLYYLDGVKQRFDEEKTEPILIDQTFKDRLGVEFTKRSRDEAIWKDIEQFIAVRQYATDNDFINKVAARISRVADAKERVADTTFKECIAKSATQYAPKAATTEAAKPAPTESPKPATAVPTKSDTTGAAQAAGTEPQPQSTPAAPDDRQKCADNYFASNQDAYRQAQDRIANVYSYLKPVKLKEVKTNFDKEKGQAPETYGYFESALKPTFDDQSGLHIIYQTLRVSLIVLIVFAFISFVVLLLGRLMLTDGVKTVTDQATSFIGASKGAILPGAKGAALSIAAFGLGAAVVGGVPIVSSNDQAGVYDPPGQVKSRNPPPGGGKGNNGGSARSGGGIYDYGHNQYAYDNSINDYSFPQDNSVTNNGGGLPPVVSVTPNVTVVPAPDNESKVDVDSEFTKSITESLDSLKTANQELSKKLAAFAQPAAKEDIKVANQKETNNDKEDKPLVIKEAEKGAISTSISPISAGLTSIKEATTTALDDVQTTNLDEPVKPKERSTIARWFRGPDKYFVSKRSVAQLEKIRKERDVLNNAAIKRLELVAKDPVVTAQVKTDAEQKVTELRQQLTADDLILKAVKSLYILGRKPKEAAKFYDEIHHALDELLVTSTSDSQKEAETRKRFQDWRDTILTYTRID
jgi:hypothetical protein